MRGLNTFRRLHLRADYSPTISECSTWNIRTRQKNHIPSQKKRTTTQRTKKEGGGGNAAVSKNNINRTHKKLLHKTARRYNRAKQYGVKKRASPLPHPIPIRKKSRQQRPTHAALPYPAQKQSEKSPKRQKSQQTPKIRRICHFTPLGDTQYTQSRKTAKLGRF